MTPDEYEFVSRVFAEAVQMPLEQRPQFLDRQCAERPELRDCVEAMLVCDGGEADAETPRSRNYDATLNWSEETLAGEGDGNSLGQIGQYTILQELGRGGMGVVYKARQEQPNRIVALKMIRGGRFASDTDIRRFRAEADAAANLDHSGVVPIFEVGEHDGQPFFSMRYVDGESLAEYVRRCCPELEQRLRLFRDLCDAVAHAHERGIIHRDLKPANVLVDVKGRPCITDFGLAKYLHRGSDLTSAGDIMGTPQYMPPEQAVGQAETAGPEADVYSLGAILYELLTECPVMMARDDDVVAVLRQIQELEVKPPRAINRRVPRDLETICLKCLEKDPADRYRTAGQLVDDVNRFLEGEPIQARPPGLVRRVMRWARKSPGLATTWVAVASFFLYHLYSYYIRQDPRETLVFHVTSVAVCLTWFVGAWLFQRLLDLDLPRLQILYAWGTMDVLLLTALLYVADGTESRLIVLYPVLVAGSVLRFQLGLVAYATCLCLAAYLALFFASHAGERAELSEAVPFLLSLAVIGVVQYFVLRRFQVRLAEKS